MSKITTIKAREILDSRGNPTVEVDIYLDNGKWGRAAVPSGASTGAHEAVERRDNDKTRYLGKGVLGVIRNIEDEISSALVGHDPHMQQEIDDIICALDGTHNKARLGANAILATSLASARAAAADKNIALYALLGDEKANILPIPLMNIINGGEHANNLIDIQEFMIMPIGATSFKHALQIGTEIFHTLKTALSRKGLSTAVGDEGGFAPEIASTRAALDFILSAIELTGYKAGKDVALALDCAASEYFKDGKYILRGEERTLSAKENVDYLERLVRDYPIISIEDGCAEDDWEGWQMLTKRIGAQTQLVGDDLFVTNSARISRGIDLGAGNSVLIKINQIGTLSETFKAIKTAKDAQFSTIMSHRSGETEDTSIADLAVVTNCGQIKTGAPSRSERTAKYNQLLRIEEALGKKARFGCEDFYDRHKSA